MSKNKNNNVLKTENVLENDNINENGNVPEGEDILEPGHTTTPTLHEENAPLASVTNGANQKYVSNMLSAKLLKAKLEQKDVNI